MGLSWAEHDIAASLAHEFIESDDRTQRWIGKDALKEFETLVEVPERKRLLTSKSKMGRKALSVVKK